MKEKGGVKKEEGEERSEEKERRGERPFSEDPIQGLLSSPLKNGLQ